MWNGIRVKKPHFWQNPNKKRAASWDKYKQTIEHYKKLIKRKEIEWETKWIKNALMLIEAKFKKYWITEDMIK